MSQPALDPQQRLGKPPTEEIRNSAYCTSHNQAAVEGGGGDGAVASAPSARSGANTVLPQQLPPLPMGVDLCKLAR